MRKRWLSVAEFDRSNVGKTDIENVVKTLLGHSGALEELISFVRLVDSGTKALQYLETFIQTLV